MRIGVVVRADQRGLGIQSYEVWRHLKPERTLVIDMGELARGFTQDFTLYPDATVVPVVGGLPEDDVRAWLDGLDVVWTAETFYDARFVDWANEAGVATVCHVNPEFWKPDMGMPTQVWSATPWRLETLPENAKVVPHPVALDRFKEPVHNDLPVILHVVGHVAAGDRNGTRIVAGAMRWFPPGVRLRVITQDRRLIVFPRSRHAQVETRLAGVRNYWELYENADVLLLPRRYGGLSLPAQEAMAAGLALVMSDLEPQRSIWPAHLVRARPEGELHTPVGDIRLGAVNPRALAGEVTQLLTEPGMCRVRELQQASREWAQAHSWDTLLPLWREELAQVAGL